MTKKTSMVNVRISDELKQQASEVLAHMGLNISDVIRMLLTKIASEGKLPDFLTTDPETYDKWFRAKVQEALDDPSPGIPHEEVMASVRARIERSTK